MPWLAHTVLTNSGNLTVAAKSYWFRPGASAAADFHEFTFAVGLTGLDDRHSSHNYNGTHYGVGLSDNYMIDRTYRFSRQGIPPYVGIPALAAGAAGGPTTVSGCVGYIRFRDSNTGELSPLSAASASITLTNQKRDWTGLPTVAPETEFLPGGTTTANAVTTITGSGTAFTTDLQVGDRIALSSAPTTFATVLTVDTATSITVSVALGDGTSQTFIAKRFSRVDEIELWVSMDGGLPRFAVRRQLGATSVTENVATLALGDALTTDYERLPRAKYNEFYHNRQVVANGSDTIYLSALYFPERYEGLNFRTLNGEPVVGMIRSRDVLLVGTPESIYELRGYTADDMTFKRIEGQHSMLNHFGNVLVGGNAVIPGKDGIALYNGVFHPLLVDRSEEWATEYRSNQKKYENGFAIYDPDDKVYAFYVPGVSHSAAAVYGTVGTVGWVAQMENCIPEVSGTFAAPDWSMDISTRTIDCGAMLATPGSRRKDLYFGHCDGFIRKKDATDENDDSDSYAKTMVIRTRHDWYGDPGGDAEDGKQWVYFDSYIQNEDSTFTLYLIGGDESAYLAALPDNTSGQYWKDDVAVGLKNTGVGGYIFVPRCTVNHSPQRVSGRGLTVIYKAASPLNVYWNGFGGVFGPGRATRPYVSAVEDPG